MKKVAGSLAGLTSPNDILRALFNVTNEPWFQEYAESAAMKMVTGMFRDSGRSWREASANNGQGAALYKYLMKEFEGPLGVTMREHILRNADYIKSAPLSIAQEMTQKTMEMQMAGFRADDIAAQLLDLYPHMSNVKASLIARTEAAKTSSNLVQARAEIVQAEWYIWQTSEDGRVRHSHSVMDRVICRWDDQPNPEALAIKYPSRVKHRDGHKPAKPYGNYAPGCTFNCFPGESQVNFSNGCHKLWRRQYVGVIIVAELSNRTVVKATPNHPILTSKGWLPIDKLQKGDDLVHAFGNGSHVSEINQGEFVTSFENLFDTFGRFSSIETSLGTEFDFHGDGSENNVDVIDVYSFLADYFMTMFFDVFSEFNLAWSDLYASIANFRADGLFAEALRRVFSTHGFVGVSNKFFSFLQGKARHSDMVGITSSAPWNPIVDEDLLDSSAITLESFGQGEFAFPSDVPRDYLILWKSVLPLVAKMIGKDDTPSAEVFAKGLGITSGDDSNILEGLTIPYQLSKVVNLSVREFEGHIYNLQSNTSWYSISESNLVVHNCRCYPEVLLDLDQITWPAVVHRSGELVKMTKREFERLLPSKKVAI